VATMTLLFSLCNARPSWCLLFGGSVAHTLAMCACCRWYFTQAIPLLFIGGLVGFLVVDAVRVSSASEPQCLSCGMMIQLTGLRD
jgi:hypothetical protein